MTFPLRDSTCEDCRRFTNGDCGKHDSVRAGWSGTYRIDEAGGVNDSEPPPSPVDLHLKWCCCGVKGVCLGCLIDGLVHREFGLTGRQYLLDRTRPRP